MRIDVPRAALLRVVPLAVLVLMPQTAEAQYSRQVVLETISNYGGGGNDTDANLEGGDFYNAVTAPGTPWTTGSWWYDGLVYDTDFYDRQLTGYAGDHGDDYFDPPGTGISMFIGHGDCDDTWGAATCYSDSDCPAGWYCPGGAPLPAMRVRRCINQMQRSLITHGSSSSHGDRVFYGQTYGQTAAKSIAMGEDAWSTGFAGVGTNGGANVTIIVNSCGFRSRYIANETNYYSAGTHIVMGIAPTNNVHKVGTFNTYGFSDTAQWAARGSTLSNLVLTNVYAAMSDAWLSPSMVTQNVAFSWGGTLSVAAEGAHIVVARDSSQANADWHAWYESWAGSVAEVNDATGANYGRLAWLCNYNCSLYGW